MKLLFIYLSLVLAVAFYVWINILKEGNQDSDAGSIHNLLNSSQGESNMEQNILTSNKVTPGITTIDRYKDKNCPNKESYIYCIDGKIECQDIFGSTFNQNLTTLTNTPYEFGNTFDNTCGSYINKTNLQDYSKNIDSIGSGVYFDLSNCTREKPWRVGGTITKDEKKTIITSFECVPSQLDADKKWSDITHTKLNENATYKVNDNIFVLASYLNSSELSSQGVTAMLAVIDNNKPNTQSVYRTINGNKYYQATIYAVTGETFSISLSNLPQSQENPLIITNIPKNALIKDSLYNSKTNSYYNDLNSKSELRPVCKSGRFTSCLSKPPYTIENGIYVPTSDPLIIDGGYIRQSQIDTGLKTPFSAPPINPSGIVDKADNLLQYNYFEESTGSTPFIKCVANYGSRVGDPLCCNQNGKIPDTKNICPQEVPNCVGYSISDNVFGYCT